jgi:nitrile hydratase
MSAAPRERYHSHADLGGRTGVGRVVPEAEGEVFHALWEARAFALTLAMGATGAWNIDMSRSARETLPDYDSLSYYRIWLEGLQKLLIERGLLLPEELSAGSRLRLRPKQLARVLHAADVAAVLARGGSTQRPATAPPLFAVGECVRTRDGEIPHHTRLPHYARGKSGRVERVHGVHVFPDTNAHGLGEQPQWLYTVSFEGRELWGDTSDAVLRVSIEAWEPYLVSLT